MVKLNLKIMSGAKEGQQLTLNNNETKTIGRSPDAGWSFQDDGHMSSIHCELRNVDGCVEVIDRQSTNKTWLNEQPVLTVTKLKNGDSLRVGKTVFAVMLLVDAEIVDDKRKHRSPIEASVEAQKDPRRPSINPITDSSFIPKNRELEKELVAELNSRLRRMEKMNPYGSSKNMDVVIDQLQRKKSLRFIVHFQKIRIETPDALKEVRPVYQGIPGASTHLPVVLNHAAWKSPTMRDLSGRLNSNDALMALVSSSDEALDQRIDEITSQGACGYSQAGGFFGWCWPSAFLSIADNLGIGDWSDKLGQSIEGVLFFAPNSSATLVAYADRDLVQLLLKMGFKEAGE
jgi:FHA domain